MVLIEEKSILYWVAKEAVCTKNKKKVKERRHGNLSVVLC
jgi:hypothetical protein